MQIALLFAIPAFSDTVTAVNTAVHPCVKGVRCEGFVLDRANLTVEVFANARRARSAKCSQGRRILMDGSLRTVYKHWIPQQGSENLRP